MRNSLIAEIRRIRAKQSKERARNPHLAVLKSYDLLHKVCDVVISPTGERQFIASAQKMYDVLIVPKLKKKKKLAGAPSIRGQANVSPRTAATGTRPSVRGNTRAR